MNFRPDQNNRYVLQFIEDMGYSALSAVNYDASVSSTDLFTDVYYAVTNLFAEINGRVPTDDV